MRRGTGRNTDSFRAAVLLLALTAAACASDRKPAPPAPAPPPGPSSVPEPGGDDLGVRFPRSVDAVRQITLRKGRLGWGGLEIGMTFRQAERALGRRLPELDSAEKDDLCGYYPLEAELMRQAVRLEFATEAGESHLQAIWLPLASRAGSASRGDIVAALHARFPKLEYIPSPHEPDVPEEKNPQPLYRLAEGGGMIFVQPGGIYFGEVCVD